MTKIDESVDGVTFLKPSRRKRKRRDFERESTERRWSEVKPFLDVNSQLREIGRNAEKVGQHKINKFCLLLAYQKWLNYRVS